MRRSEALQGVRVIKFRDILGRYEASEFNQIEAAELLGVSERTFRRWSQRFEQGGEEALLDRRLGKASGKRVPADREDEVEALYRTHYSGFTVRHFHEHLVRDHQFAWGYTWTKSFLQSKGPDKCVATDGLRLHLDEELPAIEGAAGACQAARRAPAQAPPQAIARHDAASRRLAPRMVDGPRRDGPDRDHA